ncbi:unnamed protein product, partial [Vitis vinifera]
MHGGAQNSLPGPYIVVIEYKRIWRDGVQVNWTDWTGRYHLSPNTLLYCFDLICQRLQVLIAVAGGPILQPRHLCHQIGFGPNQVRDAEPLLPFANEEEPNQRKRKEREFDDVIGLGGAGVVLLGEGGCGAAEGILFPATVVTVTARCVNIESWRVSGGLEGSNKRPKNQNGLSLSVWIIQQEFYFCDGPMLLDVASDFPRVSLLSPAQLSRASFLYCPTLTVKT